MFIVILTPIKHPEKSSIFLGTRFIPLSFQGEGEYEVLKGWSPFNLPFNLQSRL